MNLHNIISTEQDLYLAFYRYFWPTMEWRISPTTPDQYEYDYPDLDTHPRARIWRILTRMDRNLVTTVFEEWRAMPEPRPTTRVLPDTRDA